MSEMKTCFKRVDYDLSGLLHYIDIGDIGLPDIQRPFVWPNTKVRDLFDSMYRGFPVGYLLFWENGDVQGSRQIGTETKQREAPQRLIVDGQQRMTSLYAVFRGKKVLDADYKERHIEIAFRPRDGAFEVADATIKRNPEWIANVSKLWSSGSSSRKLVNDFISQLSEKHPLTEEEEENISHNLDKLFDLQKYPFTVLEIAPTVDEEEVANIFVRINSEGVKLNQADFILTLLSVFWDEGRAALEFFCRESRTPETGGRASPYNHFIQPDPDQLLRASVAVGFNRGRLKSVYQILRGKDMETGEFSPERQDEQFGILAEAQAQVLDLTSWHQFFSAIVGAGFRGEDMISSQNTLLYCYAFYLIGRNRYRVPEHSLQKLIGRWFFTVSMTGRYTGSFESTMDSDLNRIKGAADADGFCHILNEVIDQTLTHDYWTITLPAELDSSSARNPFLFAFMASQNRLNAPVLFSHKKIADLLDPAIRGNKKALERHHLFPKKWLEKQGIDDRKDINQIANLALLEWPDNISISDEAPASYVPGLKARFNDIEWTTMHRLHAIPIGWENMEYHDFLLERRKLMADIIRQGFETLSDNMALAA